YEGFGEVATHVHFLGDEKQRFRAELYARPRSALVWHGVRFAVGSVLAQFPALVRQIRHPVKRVSPLSRALFVAVLTLTSPLFLPLGAVGAPLRLLSRRAAASRAG